MQPKPEVQFMIIHPSLRFSLEKVLLNGLRIKLDIVPFA